MARAGLNRERVLALAAEIVDQQGPEALTLAALAASVGVKSPSLYKHVDGLPDIIESLTAATLAELTALLREIPRTADPQADLRAFGRTWRDFARSRPGRYALAAQAPRDHGPGAAAATEIVAMAFERLGAMGVVGLDQVHATRGIRALVHGFIALEAQGGFGMPVDVDHSFDRALEALVGGWGAAK